jgi:hypothetical protein
MKIIQYLNRTPLRATCNVVDDNCSFFKKGHTVDSNFFFHKKYYYSSRSKYSFYAYAYAYPYAYSTLVVLLVLFILCILRATREIVCMHIYIVELVVNK